MSIKRKINKIRKLVLRKLEKWERQKKYDIDFDSLKININLYFDILIKEGLKFNINTSRYKILIIRELERVCLKTERNKKIENFDILFIWNSKNDENEELLELKRHKIILNAEIYRPILELMYYNKEIGQPNTDVVLNFGIFYLQAKYNLSDEQVLKDIKDRASFQYFLAYP